MFYTHPKKIFFFQVIFILLSVNFNLDLSKNLSFGKQLTETVDLISIEELIITVQNKQNKHFQSGNNNQIITFLWLTMSIVFHQSTICRSRIRYVFCSLILFHTNCKGMYMCERFCFNSLLQNL